MTALERYRSYVDEKGPRDCWPWLGHRSVKNYGVIANGKGGSIGAHRYGFEAFVRPLRDGEVVDHLCHGPDCPGGNACEHRACQNPAHWQAVTPGENTLRGYSFSAINARKTHCKWGHELTPENCYNYNGRACKTCARLAARGQHPRQMKN